MTRKRTHKDVTYFSVVRVLTGQVLARFVSPVHAQAFLNHVLDDITRSECEVTAYFSRKF